MVCHGCQRLWKEVAGVTVSKRLVRASLACGWIDDSVAKRGQSIMISDGASLQV